MFSFELYLPSTRTTGLVLHDRGCSPAPNMHTMYVAVGGRGTTTMHCIGTTINSLSSPRAPGRPAPPRRSRRRRRGSRTQTGRLPIYPRRRRPGQRASSSVRAVQTRQAVLLGARFRTRPGRSTGSTVSDEKRRRFRKSWNSIFNRPACRPACLFTSRSLATIDCCGVL